MIEARARHEGRPWDDSERGCDHPAPGGPGPHPARRGRPGVPLSPEDVRRSVEGYVRHYNEARSHSAIGDVTPAAKMAGLDRAIFVERDRKSDAARERRRIARARSRPAVGSAGRPSPIKRIGTM